MGIKLIEPESLASFLVVGGAFAPSSAPVLSLVSLTDTTVNVSCTSVTGATGYKFYKDGVLVATQAGTTYQYTGLTIGTAYALTCKGYNAVDVGPVSNTLNQTTSNIPYANLIASYPFDGDVLDYSGNGYDLALTNSQSYPTGKVGSGCFLGDGTGSSPYALGTQLITSGSFWINFWIKFTSTGGWFIVSQSEANNLSVGTFLIDTNVVNKRPTIRVLNTSSTPFAASWGADINDGNWHMVDAGYNSVTGKAFVGVDNGTLVETTVTGTVRYGSTWRIGNLFTPTLSMNCSIDAMHVFSIEPTAAMRTAMYNGGSGVQATSSTRPVTLSGTSSYIMENATQVSGGTSATRTYRSTGDRPIGIDCYGTSAILSLLPSGGTIYVYVDGALANTVTTSAAWQNVTVTLGSSDAWHYVEVRSSNSSISVIRENTSVFARVYGTAPAARYPSTFSSPIIDAFEATSSVYVVDDGTAFDNVSGRQGGWLRFKANTSRVKVCVLKDGTVALYEAGAFVNGGTQSVDGNQWLDLGAVSGGSEKEYWLFGDFQISGISAASVNTGSLAARDKWQFLGDSITRGYLVTLPWYKWASDLAIRKGVACLNYGHDGTTLVSEAASIGTWVTAAAPKYVIENYGHNDAPNGAGGIDAFKDAQYDAIVAALGVAGVTKYFKVGMFNFTGNANRSLYNSAAQSICTGGMDSRGNSLTAPQIAKVTYVDTDGWIDPATNTSDGTHPNDGAGAIIGALAAAAIS